MVSEGMELNGNEVHVLWCNHKLRRIYKHSSDAIADLKRLREAGYKDCYVSCQQLQYQTREAGPITDEQLAALKRCVERS